MTSVSKHPKADRLMVCTVSTGDADHQVVTNALDVRAGMLVAFAVRTLQARCCCVPSVPQHSRLA